MRSTKLICLAVVMAAIGNGQINADIVDQINTEFTQAVGGPNQFYQTFRPTQASIDWAAFDLVGLGTNSNASVSLFSGAGSLGSLLATSNNTTIIGDSTYATYQFDFSSSVPLTIDQTYTLRLTRNTSLVNGRISTANPYARGNAVTNTGDTDIGFGPGVLADYVFAEGVSSVPEPSSFAFLALGAFGLIGCRRRSRK